MLLHGTSKTLSLCLSVSHPNKNLYTCSYYESASKALLPDFFNPHVLDGFIYTANRILNATQQSNTADTEVWLGETSSCYGGGAPVLSSSYIAGFM